MPFVEVIEHTADVGLRVRAADAAEAFGALAEGTFDIIVDRETVRAERTWTIEASADDWPDLVVAFLEELLYRFETEGNVLRVCRIVEISREHVRADVSGEAVDRSRQEYGVQIKAVTYHHLKAAETAEGFEIEVIFDI